MRKLILLVLVIMVTTSHADGILCKPQQGVEVWWEDYDDVVVVWRVVWGSYPHHKERLALLPYGQKLDTTRFCY